MLHAKGGIKLYTASRNTVISIRPTGSHSRRYENTGVIFFYYYYFYFFFNFFPLHANLPINVGHILLTCPTFNHYKEFPGLTKMKIGQMELHPKLRNISPHNVTHSLISQNPRERMFIVQISLLIVTFLFLISWVLLLMQTTQEVNLHPCVASCVNMWSVTFLFLYFS